MPPRLRNDIATTATDDGLVLLDERTGRYWQLNSTGAYVMHALAEGHCPDHIAQHLATCYHIGFPEAKSDVIALIDRLSAAKLLAHS